MTNADGRCLACLDSMSDGNAQVIGYAWWAESFPFVKPPYHLAIRLGTESVPEYRGNLSGTLATWKMLAACGKEFKIEIDSGD